MIVSLNQWYRADKEATLLFLTLFLRRIGLLHLSRRLGQRLKPPTSNRRVYADRKGATSSLYMAITASPIPVPQLDNTIGLRTSSGTELKKDGDMTVKASIMNLVKNVVGR